MYKVIAIESAGQRQRFAPLFDYPSRTPGFDVTVYVPLRDRGWDEDSETMQPRLVPEPA